MDSTVLDNTMPVSAVSADVAAPNDVASRVYTAEPPAEVSPKEKKKKKKEPGRKLALRIIISVVVIALGIYLILYLVARAAMYDSIGSMLQHMFNELSIMVERILA